MIMTYEQIVAKAKEIMAEKSAKGFKEHIAAEIHITGEGEGAYYIEILDEKIYVEPYEYYDRDFILTASALDLLGIVEGTLDAVNAYTTGKIKIEGSIDKALAFQKFCKSASKPAAKTTASKPAAKPAAAAKKAKKK
ncbi:MAG: SCP2 sterol-binding domain-containing protein [Oscillospiraceae bacterium]